jgi:uncharacterized protein YcbK (DUF882 family)
MLRRAARLTAAALAAVALASAVTAAAHPPTSAHSRRPEAAAAATRAATLNAASAAYLAGKQALVGLHAPSEDAVPCDMTGRPMLSLRSVNRGESLAIASWSDDGGFASVDLDRVAHLLRSAGGEEHPIDPRTLALAYRIQRHFAAPEIRVVSGYRVPRPGSRSNHGKGRAIDLIVPGTPDEDVARFARELGFVGVGVYPASQFVHVDIRPRSYFWVDTSGPHMRNRERGILGDLASRSDLAAAARGDKPIEPFLVGGDVDGWMGAHAVATPDAGASDEDEDDEN